MAVAYLEGRLSLDPVRAPPMGDGAPPTGVDLAAIRGQSLARRALEVAAAGRHNLLILGPRNSSTPSHGTSRSTT